MPKIITLFNHKGGVGKTTLAYNLAYAMAELDKKVLLLDADSQLNLTSSVYGFATDTEYSADIESKWTENTKKYLSIKDVIDSAITNKPTPADKMHYQSRHCKNLFLLSGSLDLPSLESELHTFVRLGGEYLREIPYRIEQKIRNYLKKDCKDSEGYDFIVIDTSPNASSIINAILLMMSDYFIAPVTPSFYSMQAIQNLKSIFTNWLKILEPLSSTRANPLGISCNVKFLGLCVQMVRRYAGKANVEGKSNAHYEWSHIINKSSEYLLSTGRAIPEKKFLELFPGKNPFLIELCIDISAELRSIAEKSGKPIIAITQQDCYNFKNKRSKRITDITNETFTLKGEKTKNEHYASKKIISDQIQFIANGLLKLDS